MTTPMTNTQFKRAQKIVRQIVDMQREMLEIGLPVTSAALGVAMQKIGWEMADRCKEADRITPSERARRNYYVSGRERDPFMAARTRPNGTEE